MDLHPLLFQPNFLLQPSISWSLSVFYAWVFIRTTYMENTFNIKVCFYLSVFTIINFSCFSPASHLHKIFMVHPDPSIAITSRRLRHGIKTPLVSLGNDGIKDSGLLLIWIQRLLSISNCRQEWLVMIHHPMKEGYDPHFLF
jgi:hypothetical protein